MKDQPTLEEMMKVRGYLHESHKVLLANDPDFLRKYDELYNSVLGKNEGGKLPVKTRELIVIGILASKGEYPALELHIKRALELGDSPIEILEALETTMFYAGAPSLMYGVETLQKVLQKMNLINAETRVLSNSKSSSDKAKGEKS
jgi:alkylhydroperoxidase/carboxymuconolactone decarboxylase family protein YurZ